MNKIYALILLLLVVSAFAYYFTYNSKFCFPNQNESGYFTFKNKNYNLTHVDVNLQEWRRGLMNYTVTNSTFELLVFPFSSYDYDWMKNTYYPIDIFWANNTRIVYIVNDAIPCISYDPNQTNCIVYTNNVIANYQFEAKAGFVNKTDMKVGDTVIVHLHCRIQNFYI